MKREDPSKKFPLGSTLPEFTLKNVDSSQWSSSSTNIENGLLIVFACNHCPYVRGSEDELIKIANKYSSEGLAVVAINSNDPVNYPDDNYEKMQEKSQALNLPYPYLFDETQEVAKLFDAACTPECYLFDKNKKLVFHGAVNDNPRDRNAVKSHYLRDAVEDLLAAKAVRTSYAHPMGCSIKWK